MSIENIHDQNRNFRGAKGLIYLGESTLLGCIRDENTDSYPGYLDLIGGGREPRPNGTQERPFDTFQRETWEEVNLWIRPRNIVHTRWYPSEIDPEYTGVFFVAQLPLSAIRQVKLGEEGKQVEYFDSLSSLIDRPDLIPVLRRRTEDYAHYIGVTLPLHAHAA